MRNPLVSEADVPLLAGQSIDNLGRIEGCEAIVVQLARAPAPPSDAPAWQPAEGAPCLAVTLGQENPWGNAAVGVLPDGEDWADGGESLC